jgi:hypothetical protein
VTNAHQQAQARSPSLLYPVAGARHPWGLA